MSSSTITVNPRRRTAKSPPPAAKTDDTTISKGTVLLRNPLPKYSFQQKLDRKKTEKDSETKTDKTENKVSADKVLDPSKVKFDLQMSEKEFKVEVKDESKLDTIKEKLNTDTEPDLRIGVLVNSFPQNSISYVDQSADGIQKKASNNIEPEVVKTMIEKLKPVNIVDPITCSSNSGTKLSHSYSESAIGLSSSGLQQQREENAPRGQGSETVPLAHSETSLPVQRQIDNQSRTSDQSVIEALSRPDSQNASGMSQPASSTEGEACFSLSECKDKIKQLEEEKQLLKQQLEVQLQCADFQEERRFYFQVNNLKDLFKDVPVVNCELKKLLVASIGEDLHHRVERLTRDRALMSQELGDYSRKVSEDYEHLDKISIQADMWRSKYLASRVMSDELASARAFYSMQYQECQMALQQLLNERHELRANLFETYRGLHQIRSAFDPLNSQPSASQLSSKNVLDLARANQQLAEAIKYRLLPSHVIADLANKIEPDWHDYLTKAETHARELLAREVRPEDFRHLVPKSLAAPLGMTVDRFHPCTRYDNLTINVCCQCKGDISIV